MGFLLAFLLSSAVPLAIPPPAPHAQSADEANAPVKDVSHPPSEATDRLVLRTCTKRNVCTERFESRNEPQGDAGVLVVRKGNEVQVLAPSDYVPPPK